MNQITPQSKPASSAEISSALQVLFDAMPFKRGGHENAALAYVEALSGYTTEAVTAGIRKFLRGECDDVSTKYVPSPPELATIVRTAAIPERIPASRRIRDTAPDLDTAAKARMRLKMPMFRHAFGSREMMDELDSANREGLGAMLMLARKWKIPVPDGLSEQSDQDWELARNRAWLDIERSSPPFLKNKPAE